MFNGAHSQCVQLGGGEDMKEIYKIVHGEGKVFQGSLQIIYLFSVHADLLAQKLHGD